MERKRDGLSLRSEGGYAFLPGLSRHRHVAMDEMGAQERLEFVDLVARTRYMDRPEPPAPDPRVRDGIVRIVTITMDGREREMRIADPIADSDLAEIVGWARDAFRRRGEMVA